MIYYKLIAAYNIAMGKQFVSFVLLTIGVICNVIANLILIPRMGIYGAGLASVVSYAICSMLFILYFNKETGIKFSNMLFLKKGELDRFLKSLKRKDKTQK